MSVTDGNGSGWLGPDATQTAASCLVPRVHATVGNGQTLPDRSSSPGVKRRASELEGVYGHTRRDSEISTVPISDAKPISHSGSSPQLSPKIQNGSPEHTRAVSVDMFEHERSDSTKSRTVTSSLEDSPTSTAELHPPSTMPNAKTFTALNIAEPLSSREPVLLSIAQDDLPTLDEQVAKVESTLSQTLSNGQTGFIVARQWLARVLSRSSEGIKDGKYAKSSREGEIGPIDNSHLVAEEDVDNTLWNVASGQTFVPLKKGLTMGHDFEVLPQEAWSLILRWYGLAAGSPTITRRVINTSPQGQTENLFYELEPPVFTVLKVENSRVTPSLPRGQQTEAGLIRIRASLYDSFNRFLKRAKFKAGIDVQTKVRVWGINKTVSEERRSGLITPAASRSTSPVSNIDKGSAPDNKRLVMGMEGFMSLQPGTERDLLDQKDNTANENYNGHLNLDMAGMGGFDILALEEQLGGPAGGEWLSDTARNRSTAKGMLNTNTKASTTSVQMKLKPRPLTTNGKRGPAPNSGGAMTRGRQRKDGKTSGTTGLTNLGNTCYMNSALQCVRSVEELTLYFLQDKYRSELNPSNPLSHNGEVARQYALLLHSMYDDGGLATFAPRQFKNTIGKFATSFTGWAQQDSQEFLGFLLDGLQEDLNRVHKKPYIEKPDSTDEMINDPEAIRELGERCWSIYKARNDSVIADLFAGTYKSTLVCPVCGKVSITFDPFNTLTLQLPIENMWCREIYFFPLCARPVRIAVDIDKNGSMKMLKEYVAKKANVDPNKLVIAEVYKNKFYKVFDDFLSISEASIQTNDDIGVFEVEDVPTNFLSPKKKQNKVRSMLHWQISDEEEENIDFNSPLADKLLVPIFNRCIRHSTYRNQHFELFAAPSYIVVTREEAKDYETILRKVLAKVDTMTTRDLLRAADTTNGRPDGHEDFDTISAVEEDADSSSESRIKTHSVDGEDGFVDVSMKDSSDSSQGRRDQKTFLEQSVFDVHTSIPPELRNLFVMKYFSSSSEMVPLGWNTLNDGREEHTTITSRIPAGTSPRVSFAGRTVQNGVPSADSVSASDDDIDDIPEHSKRPLRVMNTESNSESEDLPSVHDILPKPVKDGPFKKVRPRNGGKILTYSKKGKQSAVSSDEEPDPGPLIRLGEGLILDWTPQGYEKCFGGLTSNDPTLGKPTWENISLLPDPELMERKALRMNRRKKGVSLDDCLDEFGKDEILSENDAWYCPRCKEHRRASKKFELWRSPDILVIHLKRFSASRGLRDKIDVLVDFPVEGLELGERVALKEGDNEATYDLFAVDNHYGGLGGGHYTAFAQNFIDKNWYEYNDSHVSRKTNPESVVTTAAYLLFYRRRSQSPLGGSFFAKVISDAQNSESESEPDISCRDSSPAGDGKRLDDSSRNGSSSASVGTEAIHQAGGGLTGGIRAKSDNPPSYSGQLPTDEQTLEGMDVDDEDGGSVPYYGPMNAYSEPQWSFDTLAHGASQITAVPPGSDEEDLFEGSSDKAADGSSVGLSDPGERMADFADDEGAADGFENTPGIRSLTGTPVPQVTTSFPSGELHLNRSATQEDDDDGPVMEVHVDEGEGLN
ncbi:MAG: CSN-associated deubiquitinating enzyme Ubp12 [Candelina mexicana]|nr:MAG: CSN-associated deubiquitinating enzyme Ubp12 [Candelina mexicana]